VCPRLNLLDCRGHDVPPVVTSFRQHHSVIQSQLLAGSSFQVKIVWFNLTP
jgi:hypothetical protein